MLENTATEASAGFVAPTLVNGTPAGRGLGEGGGPEAFGRAAVARSGDDGDAVGGESAQDVEERALVVDALRGLVVVAEREVDDVDGAWSAFPSSGDQW